MQDMQQKSERKAVRNDDLIKDYQNNVPLSTMIATYGVSGARIYQILDFYNIPRRGTHSKPDRNLRIAKAFNSKVPVETIAEDNKISVVRVYQILDQMGIKVKG